MILGWMGNVNACQSNILKTSEFPSWCRHNATAYWLTYTEHEVNIESVSQSVSTRGSASMVRNEQSPLELSSSASRLRSNNAFVGVSTSVSCVPARLPRSVLCQSRLRAASVSSASVRSGVSSSSSRVASHSVASVLRCVASQLRRVASRLPESSSDTPKSRILVSLVKAKQAAVERMLQRARQRLSRLSPMRREPAGVKTPIPRFAYGASSVEGSAASRQSGAQSCTTRVLN